MRAKFSAVVAMNRNNVISIDGEIPWHHSQDLKNFRQLTWGHIVLMGRNTFDSIKKPLKGRFNAVLTGRGLMTKPNVAAIDSSFITSLAYSYDSEVFIIGGAEVYRETAHLISRLYITIIDDTQDSSSALYFPWTAFGNSSWKVVKQEQWKNAVYLILDKVYENSNT